MASAKWRLFYFGFHVLIDCKIPWSQSQISREYLSGEIRPFPWRAQTLGAYRLCIVGKIGTPWIIPTEWHIKCLLSTQISKGNWYRFLQAAAFKRQLDDVEQPGAPQAGVAIVVVIRHHDSERRCADQSTDIGLYQRWVYYSCAVTLIDQNFKCYLLPVLHISVYFLNNWCFRRKHSLQGLLTLTLFGLETHMREKNWVIIGLDNCLAPDRRQAII